LKDGLNEDLPHFVDSDDVSDAESNRVGVEGVLLEGQLHRVALKPGNARIRPSKAISIEEELSSSIA